MYMNREGGALLIVLVIAMMIAAMIGAGMLYFTTTSTYGELFSNRQARAGYLAEAGGRCAMLMLADNKQNPNFYPGGESPASTTFRLQGGDSFTLSSRDYAINGVPDPGRVVVESIGIVGEGGWMQARRKITYNISRTNPIPGGGQDAINFIIDEEVFVYGTVFSFSGGNVVGPDATMVVKGDLVTDDLNRGASIAATTIWIDGNVDLDGGSASLGSGDVPGNIYIDGNLDLWNGTRHIYGDVYVNGDFRLKDAQIHGTVYVNGDLTLGWTPWLADDARIYYTGSLTHPAYYNASILAKCIQQDSVPGFTMPAFELPAPRAAGWYADRGYVSGGDLVSGLKVHAEGDYVSSRWRPTTENVIIVSEGDISITRMGGSGLTGVLYAPYGKVTFSGAYFNGIVIARDGFEVTSGGTTVTFLGLEHFIDSPSDYPFMTDPNVIQY